MKILLIAWFDPAGTGAVLDHINSIKFLSAHQIDVLNTFELQKSFWSRKFLYKYDGIIFHNTVTYNPRYLKSLEKIFLPSFKLFPGVKVFMKQDEMKLINETISLLKDWEINVLTTCLDSTNVSKVYGDSLLRSISVVHTLTGYVTEAMRTFPYPKLEDRKLDVVYRGMITPFEWGQLGHEKFYIGEEFRRRASSIKLKTDISSNDSDRIYGGKWLEFLSSSRATLAVESGASIFDFNGEVEILVSDYLDQNPKASFNEIYKDLLWRYESPIRYNQISPRHLEATSCGTVQIMFEGTYSGLFKKDVHYIPLKKDFSNFEEVISKLNDLSFCNSLVAKAINDILYDKTLEFSAFVAKLDTAIGKEARR